MPKTLAQYLRRRSREICADNQCMDDDHKCESYAYITADYRLIDICIPDYFQGYAKPYAAISLPWTGNQHQLERVVDEQLEGEALGMVCRGITISLRENRMLRHGEGQSHAITSGLLDRTANAGTDLVRGTHNWYEEED